MKETKLKVKLIGALLPVEISGDSVVIPSPAPNAETLIETAYLQCQESAEYIESKRMNRTFEQRVKEVYNSEPAPQFGVFEHGVATFQITGISRALSHQLVRHRIASYDQMSQRVVHVTKMGIITPGSYDPMTMKEWKDLQMHSENFYINATNRGVPAEDARFGLLNGVETQLIVTMNFRSWIHFLKLRTNKRAQWEIRAMAEEIYRQLQVLAPTVFNPAYEDRWE